MQNDSFGVHSSRLYRSAADAVSIHGGGKIEERRTKFQWPKRSPRYGQPSTWHDNRKGNREMLNGEPDVSAPPRVLIVDDEEGFRLTVEDGLSRYRDEFVATTAKSGVDALQSMDENEPTLVVSDIRMPDMDGIELLLHCRRLYPHIPVVLLSAYFSEELERSANSFGAARILHKPLDLRVLVTCITEVLATTSSTSSAAQGYLSDFNLAGFLQLLAVEGRTCGVTVDCGDGRQGEIWLERGEPWDAICGKQQGIEAALTVLGWESGHIKLIASKGRRERRVCQSLNFLLMEAARLADEAGCEAASCPSHVTPPRVNEPESPLSLQADESLDPSCVATTTNQETPMAIMEDTLSKFRDINGFLAAGAFAPSGEMLAEVSISGASLGELGALANDVLLKAQKSTDIMGVGRGDLVQIEAPRANILVRCLNENGDFSASEPGKAHLHCVLVLEKDGNIGLGKMRLGSVIQELAPQCR